MEIKPRSTGDGKQSRRDFLLVGGVLLLLVGALVAIYLVAMPHIEDMMARPEPEPAPKDELQVAAERGEAWAQFRLGFMYSVGVDRSKDMAAAAGWMRKAADQNHGDAQFELAAMYSNGDGVEKDLSKAYYWFYRAEIKGHKLAAAKLKLMEKELSAADRVVLQKRAKENSQIIEASQDVQNLGK
tara:strand:- start:337 stop:891 length:555 start_codon:yes stop_codon:yes gene_type:complete